ncbi:MAG: hypothetical protein KAS36_10185, partial [Anaerolineales bacterium]|nr:hypothetical protein [Anaerolineales bacterium]
ALRKVLDRAVNEGHLISEEVGIVNNLFERFDKEITRKTKELTRLEGELHQLKLTKRLVIDMIKDTVSASERAQAREETFQRMKEGKASREAIFVEEEEKPKEEEKPSAKRKRTKKEKK